MRKMRALASSAFLTALRVTLGASRETKEWVAGSSPVWAKTCWARSGGEGVFPGAGVGVELVGEVLGAAVGVGVGPDGRAEQG
jgi:hypothetical protein